MVVKRSSEEITSVLMGTLQKSRYGMTIADIVRKTGISRNTVGKYLTILCTLGQVEMHIVGPAQVYNLSNRIPITKIWLEKVPFPYILISTDGKIKELNTKLCELFSIEKEKLISKKITESGFEVLNKIADTSDYNLALEGKIKKETEFDFIETEGTIYVAWTYPVVLYDGSYGIISSLTPLNSS
ncbi:hypothetical protein [Methanolacinia paynteri]|uniref:hypothetical protein n=1 Tax=Methanolacinia paynteri TaxID=230356 RepID=UPI00064EF65F|nr:hypothetical protein [Methanolacinia paynteri]